MASPAPGVLLDEADLVHYAWLQVPMWVFDPYAMAIRWANTSGLAWWGADSLDTLSTRDFGDATVATRERLAACLRAHAEGQVLIEPWTLYPAGEPVTSVLRSRGMRLADGRQVILFCSEPLAASFDAQQLRGTEALQHIPVRVALHRLEDGAPVMRNPAAAAAFGPVDPQHPDDRLPLLFSDQALADALLASVRQGARFEGDALLHTLDGPRWHALDARAVRDPATGMAMLQLSARDISDLKATLHALEAARDAAEAANQAKTRFMANISHEIRTPMNGVLGLTELVLDTPLDERQRRFLTMAHGSARALMAIIDDILDVARIEADRITLNPAPMRLRELLDQALSPLWVQAHQRGLAMEWAVDDAVPDALVLDATRWRQVLLNLAGNALKFTHQGGVSVALSAGQPEADALLLVCSVTDTGIGMTPAQLGSVFEPFTQADESITRRYGGTGLGLAIAQRLVQLMGGRIEARSTAGAGSVFRFSVPVLMAPGAPDATA